MNGVPCVVAALEKKQGMKAGSVRVLAAIESGGK